MEWITNNIDIVIVGGIMFALVCAIAYHKFFEEDDE
jgi:hypothetical protein